MDMKRFFLYFMVIAALALAGCGGNGGGTTTTPPVVPTPDPMDVAIDLSGLLAGYMDLGDDMTYTIKAGESMDVGDAKFTCAAGGADCTVTVTDNKATYVDTGGMVTAMASQAATDAKDAADKAAMARLEAIDKVLAPDGATSGLDASTTSNGLPQEAVVTRTSKNVEDKTTILLLKSDPNNDSGHTDDANTPQDETTTDPIPDPQYKIATDMTAPAVTGWLAQTQMRKGTNETDYVTVYTDIKPATQQKLEYNAGSLPNAIASGNRIILTDDPPTGSTTYSSTDGTKHKVTINGIAGTLECATNCTAITTLGTAATGDQDKNTVNVNLTAGWSFESTNYIESEATQDSDYMYFGYWLSVPDTGDYAFNTFYGGSLPVTDTGMDDLQDEAGAAWTLKKSKATYTGKAAGMYVTKTLAVGADGLLSSTPTKQGQFTADASLTAYFGQSPEVASTMQNTLTGTITNFKDGDTVLGFHLNLTDGLGATDTTGNILESNAVSGSITGTHGKVPVSDDGASSWEAKFYGPSATSETKRLPTGVAGDFEAHFSDASVVGGFGAAKK